MRNHIQISEKDGKLELTIHREIKENVWERAIRTSSPQIIKDIIRELKQEIASSNRNKEDLNMLLKDQSTVSIKNYTNLKNNPLMRPITNKIENKKKQRRFKIARAAIISLGAFIGISNYGKKIIYAKEDNQNLESEETNLENIDEITIKKGENLNPVIIENNLITGTDQNTPEILELPNVQIEEAPLETEIDDLTELDAIIEEDTIEPSETESIQTIKEAIPTFGVTGMDEKRSFVHENYGDIIQKYATISGIDASIIECILAQERGEHSREIEQHGAIGIAQVQYNLHINQTRSIYNVQTKETEEFLVTDEVIRDLEGNIKTGVAILQDQLKRYEGNIFLAVQAYNYGHGGVNACLESAEQRTGIPKEEMIHNPECLVWIEDIKNYKEGTYGDPNYLDNVFGRYTEANLTTIYQEIPQIIQTSTNEKSR